MLFLIVCTSNSTLVLSMAYESADAVTEVTQPTTRTSLFAFYFTRRSFRGEKRKPRQACSGRHLVLFLIDAEEILPES